MYRSFDIWAYEQEGTVVRYRCFEILETGRFCVQSKDFYRQPVVASVTTQLDLQFLELLLEEHPDVRSGTFDSVGAAIWAHEESFRLTDGEATPF
jgi:hypothetical protein